MGVLETIDSWLGLKGPEPSRPAASAICSQFEPAPSPAVAFAGKSISATDIPPEPPEFKRRYECQVTSEVRITIDIRNGFGGTYKSGELRQRNGNAVYFDPERVAEKIIDRELTGLVQECSRVILLEDKEFRQSCPKEFTDTSKMKWVRALAAPAKIGG